MGRSVKERASVVLVVPDDGVLAEYLCLYEEEVVRISDHLDAVEAATLPVAAVTAWYSIYELGTLRPGEAIVVLGSGGVSVAARSARRVSERALREFSSADAVVLASPHVQLQNRGSIEVLVRRNL
jgi:D-arabinose 1-dehydrogenase-like Zn-dependent alcohol dehydrogenase